MRAKRPLDGAVAPVELEEDRALVVRPGARMEVRARRPARQENGLRARRRGRRRGPTPSTETLGGRAPSCERLARSTLAVTINGPARRACTITPVAARRRSSGSARRQGLGLQRRHGEGPAGGLGQPQAGRGRRPGGTESRRSVRLAQRELAGRRRIQAAARRRAAGPTSPLIQSQAEAPRARQRRSPAAAGAVEAKARRACAPRAWSATGSTAGGRRAATRTWVFGYGSLMWRPGFAFVERRRATLHGRRRAFCIYSVHHRGTYERPGLVLGLAPGGSVRGVAYRVAAADWPDVYAYLLRARAADRDLCRGAASGAAGRRRARVEAWSSSPTSPPAVGRRAQPGAAGRADRRRAGLSGRNVDYLRDLVGTCATRASATGDGGAAGAGGGARERPLLREQGRRRASRCAPAATRMNSARFRPGGIGGRNSKTIDARAAEEAVGRPVDAGVGGHGRARQAEVAVEGGDARLVVAGRAGRRRGAFREDHQLAVLGEARAWRRRPACAAPPRWPSRSTTIIRAFGAVPAEERDPHQLLLHHEAGVGRTANWAKTSNMHWCLAAIRAGAGGHVLAAAELDPDAADRPEQARSRPRPEPHGRRQPAPRARAAAGSSRSPANADQR